MSSYKHFLLLVWSILVGTIAFAQCDYNDNSPISIGQVVTTNAACPSAGVIQINNVTGGGGAYVYEIVAGPVIRIVQSQNTFSALPAGTYRVRVSSCNGSIREVISQVNNSYTALYLFGWQSAVTKQSGLQCGATNNGVYKLSKPWFTGGTGPFRIQLSNTNSFGGVPYLPGYDSAVFTGLNASSTYYVRVTDACNNFITFNFVTAASTPVVPLSVPSLDFSRAYFYGDCTGNETVYLYFRDSASGGNYDVNNLYTNTVYWGTMALPHMRVRIEDAVNGTLYADRNVTVSKSGTSYFMGTDQTNSGQTGLPAPGVGKLFYGVSPGPNAMPYIYPNTVFPANAPLKITLFFPGGNHCGVPIAPYSRTFFYNLATHWMPQPFITGVTSSCNIASKFIRVDFNIPYAGDTIWVVKPGPVYTELYKARFGSGASSNTTVFSNAFVLGESYRVIIKDSCGRADSMNFVYTPAVSAVTAPPISDSVSPAFRCPVNPMDTVYSIYIRPLPAGYSLLSVTLSGFGTVPITAITDFAGSGLTGYKINKLLPPGTYSYSVTWNRDCQTGIITNNVVINPVVTPQQYRRGLTLTLTNVVASCGTDGYALINVEGFLKNINTGYQLNRLRLSGVPNPYVFPVQDKAGTSMEFVNYPIGYYFTTVVDTVKIAPGYSGVRVKPGQEGNYTVSIDVICPDGTIVETLSQTITVPRIAPATQSFPNLRYANALICDESGSELRINMRPLGGRRPFFYEYKRDTSDTYMPTNNGGTDSIVIIDPAPAPGTVYDLRLTDGCGNTATSRATVSSFTGRFYIYQYPVDCINNPFDVRVGTSFINGAYYTWKRNGNVIAEGLDIASVIVTGISVDSITVDVNIFGCYSRSASRTLIYTNPCNYTPLPLTKLDFAGFRLSPSIVQLNWNTEKETDLAYFEMEKSTNGIDYDKLDRVPATNSSTEHSYLLTDKESASVIFYRLKIVDARGAITYSKVVRVTNRASNTSPLQISPNPAVKDITVKCAAQRANSFKAQFYNAKGQLVKEVQVAASDLISGKTFDISALAAGSYILSLADNSETFATGKFIKQQ